MHLSDPSQGVAAQRPVCVGQQFTGNLAVVVEVCPVQFAAHGQSQGGLSGR